MIRIHFSKHVIGHYWFHRKFLDDGWVGQLEASESFKDSLNISEFYKHLVIIRVKGL